MLRLFNQEVIKDRNISKRKFPIKLVHVKIAMRATRCRTFLDFIFSLQTSLENEKSFGPLQFDFLN